MALKLALAVLVAVPALGAVASAESDDQAADTVPNVLGFVIGGGSMPVDHDHAGIWSLGLDLEHPVFTKTRVFAAYDWLWVTRQNVEATGTGHRAHLGLRRALIESKGRSAPIRLFIDAELGAGVALVDDPMTGVGFTPDVLLGLRAGYALRTRDRDSPSRSFQTALVVRILANELGAGFMAGAEMAWGD